MGTCKILQAGGMKRAMLKASRRLCEKQFGRLRREYAARPFAETLYRNYGLFFEGEKECAKA
jgi:hypothetical protein